MISVVATMKVQLDRTKDFEALFSEYAAHVRANETGVSLYQLTRSQTEPGVYKLLEIYADEAAVAAHAQSPTFKAAVETFAGWMAAAPELEHLDVVG